MIKVYDVIIVGAGPAGIFNAYEFMLKAPHLKVLMIDKGLDIYQRKCPILDGKLEKCPTDRSGYVGCHPACSITSGFGGSGAYSDGKFNITSEFGGWMTDYLDKKTVYELIKYVDAINLKHGATTTITDPTTAKVKEIERRGLAIGLKLLRAQVRHLGTEHNIEIMKAIYDELQTKIAMRFNTEVKDIIIKEGIAKGVILTDGTEIPAKYIFVAAGREGSSWLHSIAKQHNLKITNNQIDIGVRVETNDLIMEEINQNLYEGKFVYNTSVGTTVRTFCSNPSGHVVVENHGGTVLANGHAFNNPDLGTTNTNFALLVSHHFEEPFSDPHQYGHTIGRVANQLTGGTVIIQRYGDLLKGRSTTAKNLSNNFVTPSLTEAVPGDLGLVLPYNTLKSIIEMLEALNEVTPGIASKHTLLYGVETKFYSARIEVDKYFETKIANLFIGGDGAGITRGLAQAGANGVWVARKIINREQES
ncbi:MAG: NAD(P)/FAD-dependent oxidoreductase [Acholeplasmataceae bacterium]|nr:NAD(P)/FAD-dependent oxidoreductase [Acholeplasmataceae bacterium]